MIHLKHVRWFVVWAAPTPLMAQAIHGVVVDDESLQAVAFASVRLLQDGSVVLGRETDDAGRFMLPLPGEGEYQLEVARLGYETALSQTVSILAGDTVEVEFRVRPDAVLLDPITVVGLSNRGRDRFDRRRAEWGRGVFLTPDMIDSIAPRHAADVFRDVEKVYVTWEWGDLPNGGRGRLPRVRATLGRGCMIFMVNRVPVLPEPWVSIHQPWAGYQLAALDGQDVVAVEVYRSFNEVPPEFLRHTHQMRSVANEGSFGPMTEDLVNCGMVVFWTREGW